MAHTADHPATLQCSAGPGIALPADDPALLAARCHQLASIHLPPAPCCQAPAPYLLDDDRHILAIRLLQLALVHGAKSTRGQLAADDDILLQGSRAGQGMSAGGVLRLQMMTGIGGAVLRDAAGALCSRAQLVLLIQRVAEGMSWLQAGPCLRHAQLVACSRR
jgi:hypothetical protein